MPHCTHKYAQQEHQLFKVHTVTNQPSHNKSGTAATAMLVVHSSPRRCMLYCRVIDVAPVVPVTSSHCTEGPWHSALCRQTPSSQAAYLLILQPGSQTSHQQPILLPPAGAHVQSVILHSEVLKTMACCLPSSHLNQVISQAATDAAVGHLHQLVRPASAGSHVAPNQLSIYVHLSHVIHNDSNLSIPLSQAQLSYTACFLLPKHFSDKTVQWQAAHCVTDWHVQNIILQAVHTLQSS